MQLDKLQIELRPRRTWQAIDLGCRMAVYWYRPLLSIWLIVSLPIFALLIWLSPILAIMVVWWLKPIFDRALLFYLSRAVFSAPPTLTETIKHWPKEAKRAWFSSLTWRRFFPSRSYELAAIQLEQLTGAALNKRLQLLHRSHDDQSAWWGWLCCLWEWIIFAGLLALIGWFTPQGVAPLGVYEILYSHYWLQLVAILFYLSYGLVAPFYLSAGFSQYLNRRVMLEAWDIELEFKKIRQRLLSKVSVLTLCVGLTWLTVLTTAPLYAEPQSNAEPQSSEITEPSKRLLSATQDGEKTQLGQGVVPDKKLIETQQMLDDIYHQAPFKNVKTTRKLVWVGPSFEMDGDVDLSFLKKLIAALSGLIEITLWAVFIGFIGFVLFYFRKQLFFWRKTTTTNFAEVSQMPDFVGQQQASLDLTDIRQFIQYVEAALQKQDLRKAMSVIIQFSLQQVMQDSKVSLTRSMTEKECLHYLERVVTSDVNAYLKEAFAVWIQLAWAHKNTQQTQVSALFQQSLKLFCGDDLKEVQ